MRTHQKGGCLNGKQIKEFVPKRELSNKVYEKLKPTNQDDWIEVQNNEILQPDDTKDGEQYILWLKEDNETNSKIDIQFLS